eukprot:2723177-Amphidinium_carterae.1
MRNPSAAVAARPQMIQAGRMIRATLEASLSEGLVSATLDAIEGLGDGPDEGHLDAIRFKLAEALHSDPGIVHPCSGDYATVVRGRLFHKVAEVMGEPDLDAVSWLFIGAPMGIELPIPDSGLYAPAAEEFIDELAEYEKSGLDEITEYEKSDGSNYKSVDTDAAAAGEIDRLEAEGFIVKFPSRRLAEQAAGGPLVQNRLAMITKVKGDTVKRRLIVDCRASGVNLKTSRAERLQLPRALD